MTQPQKTTLITVITIAVIIGIIALIVCMNTKNQDVSGKMVTGLPEQTFSGTITEYSTACFADGICSVTVDGKKVIIMAGFRMSPPVVGKLIGVESIGDLETKIGWHANVYAATTTTPGEWTLYGDEKYYVEVLNLKK